MSESIREEFQKLLRKLFQFDCADLDFGIYRIMNHKRAAIERFITKDLPEAITKELGRGALAEQAQAVQALEEARKKVLATLGEGALDADGNLAEAYRNTKVGKEYLEAQAKARSSRSQEVLETAIYNHLYTFFSRYWQEGDFISKRRYSKKERYAIPYNGEEVYLYWANHDQYYIKTGEYFTDYTYKAPNGVTVHFKLRRADVEQNNVKGEKRFFLPRLEEIQWDAEKRQLIIPFDYRPLTDEEEKIYGQKNQQEAIIAKAVEEIPGRVKAQNPQEAIIAKTVEEILRWVKAPDALAALTAEKRKTDKDKIISYLEHHLRQYTRRNTSDFFIHKDLKGFLSRELDFYIKNEVLNLDEMEAAGENLAEGWFQLMRLIKRIGLRIIEFLAQIEDFQKMLWEKKKFVTETFYCITVGSIDKSFYSEIADCKAQWDEWKTLFHIDELAKDLFSGDIATPKARIEFLEAHPTLVLDTRHFPQDFTDRLLASFEDLDEITDGLLVHSENWQALNLLQEKYRERVKCIYIDPPFNTDANPIVYKNDYQHSSWLSLIESRLYLSRKLQTKSNAVQIIAIDDTEKNRLGLLLRKVFEHREVTCVTVVHNPSGTMGTNFSNTNEYAFFVYDDSHNVIAKEERSENPDVRDLMNTAKGSSGNYLRKTGKNCFYPIFVRDMKIVGVGDVCPDDFHPSQNVIRDDGVIEVYPIDSDGVERKWVLSRDTVEDHISELYPKFDKKSKKIRIYRRKTAINYKTVWDDPKYSAKKYGTECIGHIIPETRSISRLYPKSVYLVRDCIHAGSSNITTSYIADYFAGSGTTGHAVINLNREDGGRRKFILVEMADYFDTVLLPRIKKVTFTPEWKDGEPKRMATAEEAERSPRIVKVIRLESYEDALNNLTFDDASSQQALELFKDEYLLSYMLRWETRHSETLLNVKKLQSPFCYKLHLHRDGKTHECPVDLPETFNYLLGLDVQTRRVYYDSDRRYLVYRGTLRNGRTVVVLWRDISGWKQEDYERDRKFVEAQKLTEGADEVYVNGDSFIPSARSLDGLFKKCMFASVEV